MTIITIFLFVFITQLALFISITKHLKVILRYLSYQCDTMDRVIAHDEEYKEVC